MDVTDVCLKSLADAIQGLLGRFANADGVRVQYHTEKPRMLFTLKTNDGFVIEVDYDINKTSPEYINQMISGVIIKLDKVRKERHESPIIVTSAGALH